MARCDSLEITVQGVGTIERREIEKDFEEILRYIKESEAELLLVGVPYDENGNIGSSAKRILEFAKGLEIFLGKRGIKVPIERWDERYSTAEAEGRLIGFGVSRKKRKKVIDKMAAVSILQSYLESKS